MSEHDNLKLAIIGAGGVLNHHMKHLRAVGGVDVLAVADVSAYATDWASRTFGIARTFSDYRRMLAELPEVQAVCVCTPNSLHAEHTIAALEAGKHVLVEKPMATSVGDAARMARAARGIGKQLVVGFQYRFDPKIQMIRRWIERDAFGKIIYVHAQALRRRGIPSWGKFGSKELQGGGALVDLGVHAIEAAHWLMGVPRPFSAFASTARYIGDKPCEAAAPWGPWDHTAYDVEDFAAGMVRFDSGATLTIEASFAAHIERDVFNIQVMGERGGAEYPSGKIFTDLHGYMMDLQPAHVPEVNPWECKMRHFVDVVRGRRYNEAPPEHGLMVQQMIGAIYESAARQSEAMIAETSIS